MLSVLALSEELLASLDEALPLSELLAEDDSASVDELSDVAYFDMSTSYGRPDGISLITISAFSFRLSSHAVKSVFAFEDLAMVLMESRNASGI